MNIESIPQYIQPNENTIPAFHFPIKYDIFAYD